MRKTGKRDLPKKHKIWKAEKLGDESQELAIIELACTKIVSFTN